MGNNKLLYYILILLSQVQFCIAQDLRSGDVSFNLAALSKTDSIRLSGYISDCGEFGGHKEFIVLNKKSSSFSASFNQEPPCSTLFYHIPDLLKQRNDTLGEKDENSHLKSEIIITEKEIVLLQKYFKEFQEIGSDCGDSFSNALSEFSITTPAWQRFRQDRCNRSKIFVILRDQLFLK
jgi:hypothetical protein